MSYCQFVATHTGKYAALHRHYHDEIYGFPLYDDNALFARLVLEINQAGLNWGTILAKQSAFEQAYDGFVIPKVAAYTDADIQRLLANPAIIRNRLKINAAIYNAQAIMQIQQDAGSWAAWLAHHHPRRLPQWVSLFKQHFKFVGEQIVNEFLMSTAYLPGAHDPGCPIYKRIVALNPPFLQSTRKHD
ncbi:DNA-3-methyladenine glycosylase I [Brackiella oedipodis]|uniref:DNA-3-methyladenine glycosylase I n=1 Tax=Brackiella oedipodis TaxID=124225 RepID=UPI00048BC7C1|nr:DNA-3-methyladenine glycosylase I [Brackiella oedipodis]